MKKYSMNQLERYPIYLKYFKELQAEGKTTISSPVIATRLGYSEEQVRKDLQNVSASPGRPKKGRSLQQLIDDLEVFLGYRHASLACVVGVGHLGSALMNFSAFPDMGVRIVAGFDNHPDLIGRSMGGKPVYSMEELPKVFRERGIEIVLLTVPSDVAQAIGEKVVEAGAKAIWNFAPVMLHLPKTVAIETIDLSSSWAVLRHKMSTLERK